MNKEKIERSRREYGGFLPLELNPGEEYFEKYNPYLSRFNSVKAAIDFLLKQIGKKRIYLPYYYCPSTIEAIRKTGIEIVFYHIDEELMPEEVLDETDSVLLLVDYFGVCGSKINEYIRKLVRTELIIDRAHSFYTQPILKERVHNVYSAKKFFGIPDGAYLVSKSVLPFNSDFTDSYKYAEYLLISYEEGTNATYDLKKKADSEIAAAYSNMSKLSVGLLRNVDYDRVKSKRIENYNTLYDEFKSDNNLDITENCCAYQFPFLTKGKGSYIKRRLIEKQIYVPTLWSGNELKKNGNDFEISMMNDCVFLPVDQRYGRDDMKYLATQIRGDI